MSKIVFIIKCVQCKKEFNQGESNKRICNTCRYNQHLESMKRSQEKIKAKPKKPNPKYHTRTCPVCSNDFKTKLYNKKYCNKRCVERKNNFPEYIVTVKNNIIKIEEKILNTNNLYEQKMIRLEEQLDKINYELEKQRGKYFDRLEFLETFILNNRNRVV